MSLIAVENLHAAYGRTEVLRGVSLAIRPGEIAGIIGPNGCGKSTLLRCLVKLHPFSKGRVQIDGRDLPQWNPRELARFMAIVPQAIPEVTELTVREFVALGRHPHMKWLASPSHKDREAVDDALALCELGALAGRPLNELSGGERQRARIALAVAQRPAIMLLDEPITFLDIRHQLEILDLVARLSTDRGMTAIMVLHDINLALRYCEQLIALKDGKVLAAGPAEKVAVPETLASGFNVLATVGEDSQNGRKVCSFYREAMDG